MPNPEILEFAKILVQHVRDTAIRSCDQRASGNFKSIVAERWKKAAAGHANLDSIAKVLIPDIVDDTLFHLLLAIDQEILRLSFTASDGKTIDLPEDGYGELAGWYPGSEGWCEMYSKERFFDFAPDPKDMEGAGDFPDE
jgi:hypothetical protein